MILTSSLSLVSPLLANPPQLANAFLGDSARRIGVTVRTWKMPDGALPLVATPRDATVANRAT